MSQWLAVAATVMACGDLSPVPPARAEAAPERSSLVSLARLEPASGIIRLASATDDVVDEILIQEGDPVVTDQVLVRLAGHTLREAELEASLLRLERARLESLDVEAQQSRLRSIEAELEAAHSEVSSQKGLSEKGFTAGREFRDARLRVQQTEEKVKEARLILKRLTADASLSQREAENQVKQAEARVQETLIRSPLEGRVLRINARPGERVGSRSVLSLGTSGNMMAIGEIHANEIRLVELGQLASFSSAALPEPLGGQVEEIGEMILSNSVLGEDPTAPRGLRVVQVRVRLQPSALAEQLTNLEGQLRIYLEEPGSH
ncbi:MAG: hypothetical protein VCC04_10595 [Myxococcota bacterium]